MGLALVRDNYIGVIRTAGFCMHWRSCYSQLSCSYSSKDLLQVFFWTAEFMPMPQATAHTGVAVCSYVASGPVHSSPHDVCLEHLSC